MALLAWLELVAWPYAVAGAVGAAGPLVIHLLHRRRYRVLPWGAMELLRAVAHRQRKLLRLRDLVLLALRMLAILLVGLALARPYLRSGAGTLDERQPWHAILVLDNSLSMGYQTLEGTLWSQAQAEVRRMLESLPAGSRVSLIPAAGGAEGMPLRMGDSPSRAREAAAQIPLVDRPASAAAVLPLIRQAQQAVAELPARVVWIDDAQAQSWHGVAAADLADLPPISHRRLGPTPRENTWVAGLRLQDGLADIETPATVLVELAYQGLAQPRDVLVELWLDQTSLGQAAVKLPAGTGRREQSFEVRFQNLIPLPRPGEALFAPLRVTLTPDALPEDDRQYLAAPVVAAAPVVFVDQYASDEEDPLQGRLGETYALRALLAPRTSRRDAPRQLIQVRHLRIDQLRADVLADARLVVVAGVQDPQAGLELLRSYVQRGGPLLIAAGGRFDPVAWNAAAWQEGEGLLPLPLAEELLGQLPEEAQGTLVPFFLDYESLTGQPYFQLAGVAEEELRQLYAEPFFFRAVRVREDFHGQQPVRPAAPDARPRPEDPDAAKLPAEAAASLPRVLARYDLPGKPPFLVARQIGRGQVVFCSSGLFSSWNTLPRTYAMVVFDRMLRDLLLSTLPVRSVPPSDRWPLPLPPDIADDWRLVLLRPGQRPEAPPQTELLEAGYIGPQQRGVVLTQLLWRGMYQVQGYPGGAKSPREPADAVAGPQWHTLLAVQGPVSESDLATISSAELASRLGAAWEELPPGQMPRLGGASAVTRPLWGWLLAAAALVLLAEMGCVVLWQRWQQSGLVHAASASRQPGSAAEPTGTIHPTTLGA
jgi:hypothetical protein